jgi:hypothetical protein
VGNVIATPRSEAEEDEMLAKHLFKLFVAIAVAASIAVVGARAAKGANPYNPNAYVYGGASQEVGQAIQSTGSGSTRAVTFARRQRALRQQGFRIITDTLGGNGQLLDVPWLGGRASVA